MRRVVVVTLAALLVGGAAVWTAIAVGPAARAAQDADALHRAALVWDCHNDLAYRVL